MLFVGFAEQLQNRSSFGKWWKHLPLLTSLVLITSIIMATVQIFLPLVAENMKNIPTRVVNDLQLWRLITANLGVIQGIYGVLSIVISFWWLFSLFPYYEKRYSSVYLLFQILFQTLLVQLLYVLLIILILKINLANENFYRFYSLGWDPIIIIWTFKYTSQNPNEAINFCFLPCLVKKKYVPFFVVLLFVLFSEFYSSFILLAATLLGFLQYSLAKTSFIKLPFGFYKGIECMVPSCIKNRSDFSRVEDVANELKKKCCCRNSEYHESEDEVEMHNREKERQIKGSDFELKQKEDEKIQVEDLIPQ